jgi:hypothetical protein
MKRLTVVHGTNRGYGYGCRCLDCVRAAATYRAAWKAAHPGYMARAAREYRARLRALYARQVAR